MGPKTMATVKSLNLMSDTNITVLGWRYSEEILMVLGGRRDDAGRVCHLSSKIPVNRGRLCTVLSTQALPVAVTELILAN